MSLDPTGGQHGDSVPEKDPTVSHLVTQLMVSETGLELLSPSCLVLLKSGDPISKVRLWGNQALGTEEATEK